MRNDVQFQFIQTDESVPAILVYRHQADKTYPCYVFVNTEIHHLMGFLCAVHIALNQIATHIDNLHFYAIEVKSSITNRRLVYLAQLYSVIVV